jgi:hypothetical protein
LQVGKAHLYLLGSGLDLPVSRQKLGLVFSSPGDSRELICIGIQSGEARPAQSGPLASAPHAHPNRRKARLHPITRKPRVLGTPRLHPITRKPRVLGTPRLSGTARATSGSLQSFHSEMALASPLPTPHRAKSERAGDPGLTPEQAKDAPVGTPDNHPSTLKGNGRQRTDFKNNAGKLADVV